MALQNIFIVLGQLLASRGQVPMRERSQELTSHHVMCEWPNICVYAKATTLICYSMCMALSWQTFVFLPRFQACVYGVV